MKNRLLAGVALSLPLLSSTASAENLEELYQIARSSGVEQQLKQAQLDSAREQLVQARSVLLPYIGGVAKSDHYHQGKIGQAPEDSYSMSGYALQLSMPLYNHGDRLGVAQAEAGEARATHLLEDASQQLIFDLGSSYFNILAAQQDLEVVRAESGAVKRLYERAKAGFEVGNVIIADLEEARARYDLSQAQRLATEDQIASRWEQLVEMIDHRPQSVARLQEGLPMEMPQGAVEVWIERSDRSHPMYRGLDAAIEAAKAGIEKAKAGRYPTLTASASYSAFDADGVAPAYQTQAGDARTRQLGVALNIPLYQGGRPAAQTREARAKLREAELGRENLRRALHRQIRDSYRGIKTSIERVEALKQAEKSATTALETTQAGFDAGVRTMLDLLNAERALRDTQRNLNGARIGYVMSLLGLHRATGTLDQSLVERINRWLTI